MSGTGRVVLVGAGPGDPELLTLRGAAALREADVVVHDALASKELLALAPQHAELIVPRQLADLFLRRGGDLDPIACHRA